MSAIFRGILAVFSPDSSTSGPLRPKKPRKPPKNRSRRLHLEPLEERVMLCASLCPQPWFEVLPEMETESAVHCCDKSDLLHDRAAMPICLEELYAELEENPSNISGTENVTPREHGQVYAFEELLGETDDEPVVITPRSGGFDPSGGGLPWVARVRLVGESPSTIAESLGQSGSLQALPEDHLKFALSVTNGVLSGAEVYIGTNPPENAAADQWATYGQDYVLWFYNRGPGPGTARPVTPDAEGRLYLSVSGGGTEDDVIICLVPLQDSIPEKMEKVRLEILSVDPPVGDDSGGLNHYIEEQCQVTISITDDDHWKVGVTASDATAVERLPDVAPDFGEYTFTRYNATDARYALTVGFEMIHDPSREDLPNNKLALYGEDYTLRYYKKILTQGESGGGGTVTYEWTNLSPVSNSTNGTEIRHRFSLEIPAEDLNVKVRLVPKFDWTDEAVLFDPGTAGDPKADLGENAFLRIRDNPASPSVAMQAGSCGVWWPGLYSGGAGGIQWWDPVDHESQDAKIEIKDGAICLITTDSNNDGSIDLQDHLDDGTSPEMYRQLKINDDDDNRNYISDKNERPPLFDEPRNRTVPTYTQGQDYIELEGENDLAETLLYVWIDSLTPKENARFVNIIDIYAIGAANLEMWTHKTKGKHLHYGLLANPDERMSHQRTLDTLQGEHTLFTRTVYMEATGAVSGSLVMTADVWRIDNAQGLLSGRLETKRDSAHYEAQQSQWIVEREKKSLAKATSGHGDTIFNLAADIGLNPNEFLKWLTYTNESVYVLDQVEPIPLTELNVGHKLRGGQVFGVPNTILMAWLGEGWGVGREWMLWDGNCSNMGNLGFKVEIFDNDGYGRDIDAGSILKSQIGYFSDSKELHGMYMMGHGGSNSIGSEGWSACVQNSTVLGPLWSIPYVGNNSIDSKLQYRLGALIIQACESNNGNAKSLVSNDGIFSGKSGTYFPVSVKPIAANWGLGFGIPYKVYFGGKQKTIVFWEFDFWY